MFREEDKRHFKRYNSESVCDVTLPSGTYKAKITDYSDGIGVIIENIQYIEQGTLVDVSTEDHTLEFKGEIAWVVNTGKFHKAGIRRVDSFRGDLKDFRLADILIGINRRASTGVLEFVQGSTAKRVLIDKGDLVFASSSNEDERLGEYLLKKGSITLAEFDKASDLLRKTKQKLGKILVELCCLSPKQLFQEVRNQIEDIIISLFLWEEGTFEFKEAPLPSDETVKLQISTANIIYRGIKKMNNYVAVKKMCASIEDVLNASHNPLLIFQALSLAAEDKKILSYINGVYPLKTILSLTPLSNFETLKTISALMAIGLVYVKKADEAPAEFPVDEIFGDQVTAPPDYLENIDELFNKCEYFGYYEILGVPRDATLDDIKKAYFFLLKQFHPDRHFSFHSQGVKEKLLKIVSEATIAFEVLSDPDRRSEYNKTQVIEDEPGERVAVEESQSAEPVVSDSGAMEQVIPESGQAAGEQEKEESPVALVVPVSETSDAGEVNSTLPVNEPESGGNGSVAGAEELPGQNGSHDEEIAAEEETIEQPADMEHAEQSIPDTDEGLPPAESDEPAVDNVSENDLQSSGDGPPDDAGHVAAESEQEDTAQAETGEEPGHIELPDDIMSAAGDESGEETAVAASEDEHVPEYDLQSSGESDAGLSDDGDTEPPEEAGRIELPDDILSAITEEPVEEKAEMSGASGAEVPEDMPEHEAEEYALTEPEHAAAETEAATEAETEVEEEPDSSDEERAADRPDPVEDTVQSADSEEGQEAEAPQGQDSESVLEEEPEEQKDYEAALENMGNFGEPVTAESEEEPAEKVAAVQKDVQEPGKSSGLEVSLMPQKQSPFKGKWGYIAAVLVVCLLLGVAIPYVNRSMHTQQEVVVQQHASLQVPLPDFRHDAMEFAENGEPQDRAQVAAFRDDALRAVSEK